MLPSAKRSRIIPWPHLEGPTANRILSARVELGVTQAEAARLALVSVRTWQKYEQGERAISPPVWELFRIRAGLSNEWRWK